MSLILSNNSIASLRRQHLKDLWLLTKQAIPCFDIVNVVRAYEMCPTLSLAYWLIISNADWMMTILVRFILA